MFQEDDEIEEEIIQQDYRDRAEERRKGFNYKEGEFVELEGFEKEVKLKGLDFTLIEEPKKIDKASIIAKIKKDLTKVKENQPKKTVHPMAIKIEAFLQKRLEAPKSVANTMKYVYKYDTDPNYGISMPQFFTKKKQDEIEGLVNLELNEQVLKMIEDSRLQTKEFTIKRFQERHKFDQQSIIPVQDEDSENIFDDVKDEIKKPNVDVKQLLDEEKDEVQFDIKDYINNNLFDQKHYNQLKQEVERDQKEKEEKLKKHKKMLEGEDYYFECYQPVGLSIAEEKEHKEEAEQKKMVNPEFKEFDFIKQDFKKKKRKRVNLQNQLDQIEDILQKKTK